MLYINVTGEGLVFSKFLPPPPTVLNTPVDTQGLCWWGFEFVTMKSNNGTETVKYCHYEQESMDYTWIITHPGSRTFSFIYFFSFSDTDSSYELEDH